MKESRHLSGFTVNCYNIFRILVKPGRHCLHKQIRLFLLSKSQNSITKNLATLEKGKERRGMVIGPAQVDDLHPKHSPDSHTLCEDSYPYLIIKLRVVIGQLGDIEDKELLRMTFMEKCCNVILRIADGRV